MTLAPLPHHTRVVAHLKAHEPDLWAWFTSAPSWSELLERTRLLLLKRAVRLDRATHHHLYAAADHALAALQLDLPLTLYQATHPGAANAALFYLPGEAHVVLEGPVEALLDADELRALFGHELAHHALWSMDDGAYFVADRLLDASAAADAAEDAHDVAARRFALYTEIFADRGSLLATGDVDPVIRCLVKMQTGLSQVSAAAYLQQAEEIFELGEARTEGVTHPEMFIRARAVDRFARALDADLEPMIEGAPTLTSLDLLQQVELTDLTRRFLEWALAPAWMQSAPMLAHARLFFDDLQPQSASGARSPGPHELDAPVPELGRYRESLADYWCYLLLDLAAADPSLEDQPLAHALGLAEQLALLPRLEELAKRELKVKARTLAKLRPAEASR
ncbi:MAG: M48 family metalloprotease [Myxococcales bacterium]|nr:M48 family metalloprotease [Myxococcales bacterium]